MIVKVGNIRMQTGNTLAQQIAQDEQHAKLEKLAWVEKQPKKKFELVQRIKLMKESMS